MDLTKINGCYSKELREATREIKLYAKIDGVSVQDMKNYVRAVIEPASINANAKKRFKENLNACKTKQEIDELCRLAVVHGMYYDPQKRQDY